MAEFEPAFKAMIKHEGGYANDPHDHGGETYRGISRKNWRGWDGWPDIDRIKSDVECLILNDEFNSKLKILNSKLNSNADLQGRVKTFYKRNFWMPVMDEIADQALVNWLFDKGVNMGVRQAFKVLQRALYVDEDGVIGPQTKAHIKQSDPVELLAACRFEAKRFYTNLALRDPSQSRFLNGWLARA
ncbi:MAG: glycosyl hydrolase 108 family protein [Desulfuromonadaceae bacterium]|nr:glycosyl hydrolase 108 family protein [Desulfuromonadaceae bacterium]MDD2856917.1 glycosyl hydrolase 108 family protein [Desulfuromonadaceae bacterium]